ncbi:hypothetical protein A8924_0145 [Saccharopolyspora erythraea NRRL 2338]|uniref:Uncharacterized protein n=2 Tax=Saccharopolyspora erythraea TaxID=1836 RepID=A4FQJ3_SACEN|nr:hypothetical protein [Saccharopolyspora erythraea]EQD87713.1 hypothetical protein N599_03235 [Saccharopolyspora erythraea D]PFG92921.1 hypothetical protein A8924_0145 [Saccharopolyspora erythraea NRRL 2338]QRK89821.1 hypothetical protein JQX30_35860 [Saccharopolyspora erythraea]CAM06318.1 hypothetical protein SACE_7160 [Saccharopolyspora erythraea NRRL 2338]
MDERKLEELFREAVPSAPPASFDEGDVVRGSRRITARRRMAAAGGGVAAAAVLFAGVGFGTGLFTPGEQNTVASLRESDPKPPAQPAPPTNGPIVMSDPGTRSACGAPDAWLADALVGALPEAAGRAAVSASGPCPSGSRSAAFELAEGASTGNVSVIVSPASSVGAEQAEPTEVRRPDGTEQVVRKAVSGQVLVVRSDPDGATEAPFAERLVAIADGLAGRL